MNQWIVPMSFRLSRAAFAEFKASLRSLLLPLRSSHADEALAFAFGFRTYASMSAALELRDEFDVEYDPDRLSARLAQLGYAPDPRVASRLRHSQGLIAQDRIWDNIRRMAARPANDNNSGV